MRVIETKVWGINEHPDKEAVLNWVRNNWHHLADHVLEDVIDSLKMVAKKLGTTVDYGISAFPCHDEYIKFGDYDKDDLKNIPVNTWWSDSLVVESLLEDDPDAILYHVHKEADYIYSNEGLTDFLSANGYEFILAGKCVNY